MKEIKHNKSKRLIFFKEVIFCMVWVSLTLSDNY